MMLHFYQVEKLIELAYKADPAATVAEVNSLISSCNEQGYALASSLLYDKVMKLMAPQAVQSPHAGMHIEERQAQADSRAVRRAARRAPAPRNL